MRLSLHSVGGFTGPAGAQTKSVELDRLAPREAARLRALVSSLDFAALPASITKPPASSTRCGFTATQPRRRCASWRRCWRGIRPTRARERPAESLPVLL
jgi:hypothetical protein